MRRCLFAFFFIAAVGVASYAQETAMVLRMRTVPCTSSRGSFLSALAGPAAQAELSCSEFTLRSAKVEYRVRPRRDVLLPVGERVQIRMAKKDLLIRLDDGVKDIRSDVTEMYLLEDAASTPSAQERAPMRDTSARSVTHIGMCFTRTGDVVPCKK